MLSRMQPRVAEPQQKDEFQQKDMRAGESWQKDMRAGESWSFLKSVINLTEEQREELYHEFLQRQKQRESVQR
jgi:hypothetical protein